jgi:hypothetical protein
MKINEDINESHETNEDQEIISIDRRLEKIELFLNINGSETQAFNRFQPKRRNKNYRNYNTNGLNYQLNRRNSQNNYRNNNFYNNRNQPFNRQYYNRNNNNRFNNYQNRRNNFFHTPNYSDKHQSNYGQPIIDTNIRPSNPFLYNPQVIPQLIPQYMSQQNSNLAQMFPYLNPWQRSY